AYSSGPVLVLIAVLVLFCTLIAFVIMNQWQPRLPAPEAGLIYAAEPVFASLFALFLPTWLSRLGGIGYGNERLTAGLLIGGGLITLANVLVQVRGSSNAHRPGRSLWSAMAERVRRAATPLWWARRKVRAATFKPKR